MPDTTKPEELTRWHTVGAVLMLLCLVAISPALLMVMAAGGFVVFKLWKGILTGDWEP